LATQIELLASLQLLDQSLRTKTLAVEEGQGRVAALDEAFRAQSAAAAASRAELETLTARQNDLESRLAANEAKMKDRRMRLARIRNDKDLGVARRDVELLKEETGAIETELIGVLEQVESANAKLRGIEEEVGRLRTEMEKESGELRETMDKLSGEIERERNARGGLIKNLDEDLRRKYEMIFSRRGGVAVVEIREGICQGCRMRVPPQLFNEIQRNQQVFLCPSCQRMLYWRAERAEEANG
jgi:predicted  nucleic acid-binding Zn-ribbon protein